MISLPSATLAQIAADLGWPSSCRTQLRSVAGGDICSAYELRCDARRVFVKTHDADKLGMFEAEAAGLDAINATATIRVPSVLGLGSDHQHSWLVLEWLELVTASRATGARLGEALAGLHRHTATSFGWSRDNFIGLSPQSNRRHDRWADFFAQERLEYQCKLLGNGTAATELQLDLRKLIDRVPTLMGDYRPAPSLLHGDLWGGNQSGLVSGEPVIFDPATYYGDRETDLAMTELFGGFDPTFYAAYDTAWPREDGYETRRDLYQLYHIVNHANLFGGGYVSQARSLARKLLLAAEP